VTDLSRFLLFIKQLQLCVFVQSNSTPRAILPSHKNFAAQHPYKLRDQPANTAPVLAIKTTACVLVLMRCFADLLVTHHRPAYSNI
jgi:hypothetical protein